MKREEGVILVISASLKISIQEHAEGPAGTGENMEQGDTEKGQNKTRQKRERYYPSTTYRYSTHEVEKRKRVNG